MLEFNLFETNNIFEDKNINKAIDKIFKIIKIYYKNDFLNEILICGSVAKKYPNIKKTDVKDIDFEVKKEELYLFLLDFKKYVDFKVFGKKYENRIIFDNPFITIEFWKNFQKTEFVNYNGIKIKKYAR